MNLKFCGGCKECCRLDGYSDIVLSKSDLLKIPKERTKKVGKLRRFKKSKNDVCYFLSETGCVLGYKDRPLDCKIFPMTFELKNGEIKIYLFEVCPFAKKISKSWISKTKKRLLKELKKWSQEEISAYSKIKNKWELISINL